MSALFLPDCRHRDSMTSGNAKFMMYLLLVGMFVNTLTTTFVEQERLLEVNKGSSDGTGASKFWPSSILGDAMRIVFQNLLLEANENILQSSERVWRLLLQVS